MNKLNKYKTSKFKKYVLITIPTIALMASFTGCNKEVDDTDLNSYVDSVDEISDERIENNTLVLNYSDINDDDLYKIPSYVESLSFYECYFINDLSSLPDICPNLKYLYISNCSSLTSLDFVYELPNLESFKIYGSAYVNEDLVTYLDSNNITHNIGANELKLAHKVDNIVDSIITDDMSDMDKIKAITNYLIDNYEYDEYYTNESNFKPLESMLNYKRGVCAGYAYLANVLLRKANVNSYEVINDVHAWNLIEEDDKYYYLDITNLDSNGLKFAVKAFDHSPMFLSDPNQINLTGMSSYDEGLSKVVIPKSLVEDIAKGEELKNLYERYGTDFITFYLKFPLPIFVVLFALDGKALYDLYKVKKKKKEKLKKRVKMVK